MAAIFVGFLASQATGAVVRPSFLAFSSFF
jgi:hypothetical protein